MSYSDKKYFAAKEAKDVASVVLQRAEIHYTFQQTNGWLEKLRSSYNAYHGAYYDNMSYAHTVSFGGEQGELVNFPVNHYRNIAQHLLVMTTSSRPAMQARAVNTDYKSLIQTQLSNGILDYYMREKDLESRIKRAVEMAIVLGAGYIKMEWDARAGEMYDYESTAQKDENGEILLDENGKPLETQDTEKPLYEGDVKFTNMSPFDVVFDTYKEDNDHDWLICRTFKNKYDLAAKFPKLADKIIQLKTKSDQLAFRWSTSFAAEETDEVPVYEFYHRKSEALPTGRYLLFLAEDVVLFDGSMPYRDLPVVRIAPSEVMGTPYGYTPMFDLIPIQELINSTYSSIATNHNAFSVQNILVPEGSDITVNQLEGGLNVIKCNFALGKPESLNLTENKPEIYAFLDRLIKEMETISGVNSVARGNTSSELRSGTSLALVQSLALQFSSNLQHQYIKMIENVGTMLIKMLQDFAVTKRTVTILSGITNKTEVKEFSRDELSSISRVVVEVANPLSKTTSGKAQMASDLLQYGAIKDPGQYLSIVNTGNLEAGIEQVQNPILLARRENEKLVEGAQVIALGTDPHMQHINSHSSILDDPELRFDQALVKRVTDHILEHYNLLQTVDPQLLQILNQVPIQPVSEQNTPNPNATMDQSASVGSNPTGPMDAQAGLPQTVTGPGIEQGSRIAQPAKPPGEFANLPVLPGQVNPQG